VADGKWGYMVSSHPPDVVLVPLEAVTGEPNQVPLDSDSVITARAQGISLGD
jgi:hypothetical protein